MPHQTEEIQRMDKNIATVQHQEFSGPIPPPSLFREYDQIVPGAAERLLQMAEKQAAHRILLEHSVILSDIKKSERGQRFGFCIAVFGLVCAFALGLIGREIVAGIIGGGTLVSLASVFVYGRRQKEMERKKMRESSLQK
ncbi:DUF2335 domain-containing protein [Candidatus Uhrbacteria bacterium]|nr:DUF2335 domain-containing protein [Candidatus Uhrbacteria bacterium]